MKHTVVKYARPFLLLLLLNGFQAAACTTCNRPLQAAIFDDSFFRLFFLMILPFAFVWAIVSKLNKLE
ncbi:hypothetical protein [Pontibacter beigongshangensis]|uniref:hypothetical protein n=1 Tax=Pontibacter beigongshangensis TaxID=2574733 RepID=UPI0016505D3E|nr:hypothetical protein [Pontibacter beigongshangensis]